MRMRLESFFETAACCDCLFLNFFLLLLPRPGPQLTSGRQQVGP